MYNPDYNLVPTSKSHLWEMLEEHFDFIEEILWRTPVESPEDALTERLRTAPGALDNGAMSAIKYRDVHEDFDNRDQFLKLGRELLPYIRYAIDTRQFTPEFVQKWGMIMYCHGYIAAHYFDDIDEFAQSRATRSALRSSSKTNSQRWLLATSGSIQRPANRTRRCTNLFGGVSTTLADWLAREPNVSVTAL